MQAAALEAIANVRDAQHSCLGFRVAPAPAVLGWGRGRGLTFQTYGSDVQGRLNISRFRNSKPKVLTEFQVSATAL